MNTTRLEIALVGNPNCGKTTLYNRLTGEDRTVGNFPGVTVEKKSGRAVNDKNIILTDLPGTYSLSPYSPEEAVTLRYLTDSTPDVILNVVDSTVLERGLYLTSELCDTGIPVVVALNMSDVLKKRGITLDKEQLEKTTGCKFVLISASSGSGTDELLDALRSAAGKTGRGWVKYDNDTETEIGRYQKALGSDPSRKLSPRFYALKAFTGSAESEICGDIAKRQEAEISKNVISAASGRYKAIDALVASAVSMNGKPRETLTGKIDRIATGRFTAILLLLAIMTGIFLIVFGNVGTTLSEYASGLMEMLSEFIYGLLTKIGAAEWLKGLITDGIISGVGSVVAFLPQLALLFFALSLLEDSGYMARAAFVTDRLLRSVGLSGRSFIPMCIGFGCTVPAVMAARTIENGRLKKVTALSVPFISCSAKIPVYMMALGVFSKGTRFRTVVLIYLLGILATVLSALIMSRGVKRTGDFVLELPEYRIPTLKSVALHMKSRLGDFLTKAGTVLLLAGIVIWFLVSFDCRLNYIGSAAEKSILAYIGKALAPLLSPLGFGSWQAAVALMSGIIAKEMVVGTMNIVSGDPAALFSSAAAMSFAAFTLMYSPCVATLGAIAGELHSKRAAIRTLVIHIGIAWVTAFLIYRLALLAGL